MPLILPITEKCNQKCLFCSADGRNETTSLESIYHRIDQETTSVSVSGGETLLSSDLLKIIRYIKDRGLYCELQTNGVLLSRPGAAQKIALSGVDLVNVNFPSHKSDISDRITQTPGFFALRMEGLKMALAAGLKVRLTHIVNAWNYQELPELPSFLASELRGIDFVQFSFLKIMGAAERNRDLVVSFSTASPFLIDGLDEMEKFGIDFIVDHVPMCFMGRHWEKNIDYLKMQSGADIVIARQDKTLLVACNNCLVQNMCTGVRRDYIAIFGEDVVKPINNYDDGK
jgi:MoaA/NifB/PqqE/SkfB family radical SAM enzyme